MTGKSAAAPSAATPSAATPSAVTPRVAYFFGEDAYGLERATRAMAAELAAQTGPMDIWRTSGNEDDTAAPPPDGSADSGGSAGTGAARRRGRVLEQIEERVGSAQLFGGGTLVVVRQPGSLLREATARRRLLALAADVPQGNGLAFVELSSGTGRETKSAEELRQAVAAAGGRVREFRALTRDGMERWLEIRAAELGVSLASGTARLLAERVGAYVREGDIDRRRQSELANSELEKLALYRPGGTVGREDVAALVPEAIPASAWGFLDAVAQRRPGPAADLGARLLQDGTPLPVLVAQLHRRLRELIVVADHLAVGTRPAELPRVLRMQPYRAQKLAEQAARWDAPGLDGALEGLVELDLESKGIGLDGSPKPMSDERAALGLQVWLAERVARPA